MEPLINEVLSRSLKTCYHGMSTHVIRQEHLVKSCTALHRGARSAVVINTDGGTTLSAAAIALSPVILLLSLQIIPTNADGNKRTYSPKSRRLCHHALKIASHHVSAVEPGTSSETVWE